MAKIDKKLETLEKIEKVFKDRDKTIRTLTQGRMDVENEIKDIEKNSS